MDITTTDLLLLCLILAYGANVGLLIIQNRRLKNLQNFIDPQQSNDGDGDNNDP